MAKPNVEIKREFDPRKMTLAEFINLYQVEGKEIGRPLKNWGSQFKNIPAIAPYLDRPVIDVISEEFWSGEDSPLQKSNTEGAASALEGINAKFGAIYENVERQLTRLNADERSKLPQIKNLRGSFKKKVAPGAVKAASEVKVAEQKFDYRFNPLKMGEFYVAAAAHVRANPQDAPMINAFLFNLQVGMRPNEVLNLTDSNVYRARTEQEIIQYAKESSRTWLSDLMENASGNPFLTGFIPKTNTLVDAPLSPHSLAILGAQQQFNAELEAKYPALKGNFVLRAGDMVLGRTIFMKDTPDGPKPVSSQDITDVLKKIKVPGIVERIRPDGVAVPEDTFQSSYDARRMNATVHKLIDTPLTTAAQLKGRGVKEQGAGREGDYRRLAFGLYPDAHITAQVKLSDFFVGLAEVDYRRQGMTSGIEAYRVDLGQNFVPTSLSYDPEGNTILPAADDRPPPVRLLDASGNTNRALSADFRTKARAATPEIEVVTDADYDEIFAESESPTGVPPEAKEEPKITTLDEEGKQSLKDRLKAGANKLKGAGKLGVVGALLGLSYEEGQAMAEEAGGGPTAQAAVGAAKTVYDLFESTGLVGVSSALTSPEAQAPTEVPPMSQMTDNPVTRATAIAESERVQGVISEQQARIAEYDAREAQKPTLDDQMNELQGIKPDIEITYPTEEATQ